MENKNHYDFTKQYEEEITPLLRQVFLLCHQYGIPLFMTFAVGNDEEETTYRTQQISCINVDRKLTRNYIPRLIDVMNGFEIVPFRTDKDEDLDLHQASKVSDLTDEDYKYDDAYPIQEDLPLAIDLDKSQNLKNTDINGRSSRHRISEYTKKKG